MKVITNFILIREYDDSRKHGLNEICKCYMLYFLH